MLELFSQKAITGDSNDDNFGFLVAISGNYCIVGDYASERGTAGGDKGHAFIYERQRNGDWKQVKALTGDANDAQFGISVAISGNYCIVGDYLSQRGKGAGSKGHAFIYERQRNGEWKQVKALTGDANDSEFGRSVAISGNYCIVGDYESERGGAGSKGHAFIYERQRNGEWKQVKALTGDANDDQFGYSVAISGNYCIIGDDNGKGVGAGTGHAFIYERQRNGEWKQVKALTGDADDSNFGIRVAISGNYCIVGDNAGKGVGTTTGHAFIYERQRNGEWKQVKALTGDANDFAFGTSVAISGNYCIVGDNIGKGVGTTTGHAFIYERQRNGDWKQVKALTGDANDIFFGTSVAISGTYCIVGDNTSTRGTGGQKGHAFIYELKLV